MTRKKSKAKAKALHGSPLFMMRMPQLDINGNTLPDGMSQSEADATAAEVKKAGAALSRQGKWLEAREVYMRASNLKLSDLKGQKAILLGLVAANTELGNWDDVLQDAAKILLMDSKSIVALYHSAQALNKLSRYEEALDCCAKGLKFDSQNPPLLEELRIAKLGDYGKLRHQLLEAYSHHRIRVVPTSRITGFGALPTTHPHELPYLDPPIQPDPFTATLYCYIRIVYVERHATDTVSDYPSDKPILTLLDTFLPGSTGFATPSRTWNNLTFVPNDGVEPDIKHPIIWDPRHEYLPSTLLLYARTAGGDTILIREEMTLGDVFEQVRTLASSRSNSDYVYFELKQGMMHLFAFPKGHESDLLSDPRFKVPDDLGSATDLRSRHFFYDNGEAARARGTNHVTSESWSAREQILQVTYSRQEGEEEDSSGMESE